MGDSLFIRDFLFEMAEGSVNVFGTNQKFKEAVQLINNIPDDKLYLILSRIIKKLGIKVK